MSTTTVSPSQLRFTISDAGAVDGPRFLTPSAAIELGIVLTLSVLFPVLIHILPVPDDARLGARLLPMFYAPLLAALLGRTPTALVVALAAPWLNLLLTNHPAPRGAVVMMLQLLVFVAALQLMLRRFGPRWFLAAPAYTLGLAASVLLIAVLPDLNGGRPLLAWATGTVTMALPGLAILVFINWLVFRQFPGGRGGTGPVAA